MLCACLARVTGKTGSTARGVALRAALCGLAAVSGTQAMAQDGSGQGVGQYGPSFVPLATTASGQTISGVDVRIRTGSGDAKTDAAALEAARAAAASLVGRSYQPVLVEAALTRLLVRGNVRAVTQAPTFDAALGSLRLVVSLDMAEASAAGQGAEPAKVAFPVIYQDDRSKLTFILGGGLGLYSDSHPWFGQPELFNKFNPLAGNLPGSDATWQEGYLELGIGGATQVAELPLYVFGAASGIFSFSRNQDIFTDASRNYVHPEKGYAGILYADKASQNSAVLSFGRQTWTLNDGFLISMVSGSANAGDRGATYLGPRNATDFTALATGQFGRARFAVFYIDPDELEKLESDTTLSGVNLGYQLTDSFSADASFITLPTSNSTYATPGGTSLSRQGTYTYGLHALYRPKAPDRVWVEAEAYGQSNSKYPMSARAWYGTVGYIKSSIPWSPSISFRLASFSGDDPATETYERFDSLMSTGLGNWLQGISFGKVYRNANLNTARVQVNVVPRENMNLTFTWHRLEADQLNNLGGNPALSALTSSDLGNEYTLTLRWALDRNYYLQLLASRAVPGDALTNIGADDPWTTVQASLYVNF